MATRLEVSPSANTSDSAAVVVVGARVAAVDPANAADHRGVEEL